VRVSRNVQSPKHSSKESHARPAGLWDNLSAHEFHSSSETDWPIPPNLSALPLTQPWALFSYSSV